ncbi:MAG: hypothetical protein ACREO0_15065 [Pseudoxanthomonas sp.]
MSAERLAQQRWGIGTTPPNRDPDVILQIWMKGDQVDWTYTAWYPSAFADADHVTRVSLLTDAIWTHAAKEDQEYTTRPAVWVQLSQGGDLVWYADKGFIQGSSWPHARWLLRYWLRISWKFWKLAWRLARGRG